MKNNDYTKPIIEIIYIQKNDVITTSEPTKLLDGLFGEGGDGLEIQ